jgi:hypothetical protein
VNTGNQARLAVTLSQPIRVKLHGFHRHLPKELLGFGRITQNLYDEPPMGLSEHLVLNFELGQGASDVVNV